MKHSSGIPHAGAEAALLPALLVMALALPAATLAQPVPPDAAADPSVQVPPVVYRPVFDGTPTGIETRIGDWKRANETVGEFRRGHIDLLKWEDAQSVAPAAPGVTTPLNTPAGTPSTPPPAQHKH